MPAYAAGSTRRTRSMLCHGAQCLAKGSGVAGIRTCRPEEAGVEADPLWVGVNTVLGKPRHHMAVIWVQALQKTSVRRRTICASLISAVLCCATSLSAQESRTMEISGGISRLSTETDSTIVVLSSG